MKYKKIAFIGHRDEKSDIKEKLKKLIIQKVFKGYTIFSMGNHGNFDKMCLEICKEIKQVIKLVEIEIVVTNKNKLKAIDETYFSNIKTNLFECEDVYYKQRIIESNKQMVKSCDLLICYVDPRRTKSGAKKIMEYAIKEKIDVINIYNEKDL